MRQVPPPPVTVTDVGMRPTQKSEKWIARLDGNINVDIRARVSGYITEINIVEGSFVKKGDVLLKIDPRPFEAALAQAEAGLAKATATLGKTEADEKRQRELFEKRAASQQDFDNAVQANLASKASVAAAQAEVIQARLNLEFATLTAPLDGIVGGHSLNVGDFLNAGSSGEPVTTISQVDPIKASFALTEREYLTFGEAIMEYLKKPIEERVFNMDLIRADGAVHPHKGYLATIDRAVSEETATISASALFPNPKNILRPGQFALVQFTSSQTQEALVVPEQALVELQGKTFVWVVDSQNIARMRPVTVGRRTEGGRIISEGLKEKEKVIVEGVHRAMEGRPVSPLGAPSTQNPRSEKEPPHSAGASGGS